MFLPNKLMSTALDQVLRGTTKSRYRGD